MASTQELTIQENELEEQTKMKNVSFKDKLLVMKNTITVEPILFIYLLSSSLALGAVQNMPVEMGCRANLGLNDTVCSDIRIGAKYVAVLLGNVNSWSQPLSAVTSAILVLCFGSFSDRYKWRKPFFILPIVGELFSAIGLIMCAVFISSWPVELFFIMAFVLPSFFGGGQTVIMAIYSYISDISTQEERTTRIGFVELVSLILTPLGPALSGILFEKIGYYGVYSICFILYSFAIIYGLLFIKEQPPQRPKNINIFVDVFNIKTVVTDMIKIIFCKRLAFKRMLLILTFVSYILIKGPLTGSGLFMRLYAIREFSWKVDIYGYFHAFDITVHILGMFLAVTIFIKKFQLNDLIIAALACIFTMISGVWYTFSYNVIMYCIGPAISIFSGLFVIALRSFATKVVNPSEIAKAQALFAICEALVPIIYSSLYAKFYQRTHQVFHGAFFLLSTILVTPAFLILMIMYAVYKKNSNTPDILPSNHAYSNDIEIERL